MYPKTDNGAVEGVSPGANSVGARSISSGRGKSGGGTSLRRGFAWSLLGSTVYSGCQWGMLVALAKAGNLTMVGQLALGLAITAPIILFCNLQLRQVIATDAIGQYGFKEYLALRVLTIGIAALIIIAVTVFSRLGVTSTAVVLVVGATKSIDSLSDIYLGRWQQRERLDGVSIATSLNGIVSLVTLIAAMLVTHSIVWAVTASMLGSAVSLAFILARDKTYGGVSVPGVVPLRRVSRACLQGMARLALPLGLVVMLDSLNANVPRYFIARCNGEAALGAFAAIAALMLAGGGTVATALAQVAMPRLAQQYATDIEAFKTLTRQLLAISLALGAAGVAIAALFGPRVLSILYRPEYASLSPVLFWVMVATAIWYLAGFTGCAVTAARRFGVQVPVYLASAVVTTVCCAWLVPRWGAIGAAWALCAGMTARLAGCSIALAGVIVAYRRKPAPEDTGPGIGHS